MRRIVRSSLGDDADYTTFLGVAFPHNQAQILPYNRTVKDLGGRSRRRIFWPRSVAVSSTEPGPASPVKRGDIAMYFDGAWQHAAPSRSLPESRSDWVARRQRASESAARAGSRDRRRAHGQAHRFRRRRREEPASSRRLVDTGHAAVAFSLYPVSVDDLMAVSDAGAIMPPKSTWFEPKLSDGLLIHLI